MRFVELGVPTTDFCFCREDGAQESGTKVCSDRRCKCGRSDANAHVALLFRSGCAPRVQIRADSTDRNEKSRNTPKYSTADNPHWPLLFASAVLKFAPPLLCASRVAVRIPTISWITADTSLGLLCAIYALYNVRVALCRQSHRREHVCLALCCDVLACTPTSRNVCAMQRITLPALSCARGLATKSFSVSVAQLLGPRAQSFESVAPQAQVLDAVNRMAHHNVGSLIVLDGAQLAGIITERDVLLGTARLHHAAASGLPPLLVSDIMTRDPVTVPATATVGDCLSIMTDDSNRFRHLPVVDEGELVGVLSIRDLCDQVARDHHDEVAELSTQVRKLALLLGNSLSSPPDRSWLTRLRESLIAPRATPQA